MVFGRGKMIIRYMSHFLPIRDLGQRTRSRRAGLVRHPTSPAVKHSSFNKGKRMVIFALLLLPSLAGAFVPTIRRGSSRPSRALAGSFITSYEELGVSTGRGVSMVDITEKIKDIVEKAGVREGVVTVMSKHSTVGIMVNEWEPRFVDDARHFLLKLAPREGHYLHNDLDYR
mmetsp:Transcript_46513/g.105104  ORF Transcript_46513/g.105104 Transcript_46513/m.105104 type:complete len:172 (-) Transcript_46513:716-1231(-)